MEETDVIIKLKPKKEWTTARSKEALADKMKIAMSVIPGIDFEFTQPIEMRFNELITGVRSDVAIKIYGEDLDLLYEMANRVNDMIRQVPGAADINVEKIAGLPQMKIAYNRNKIAQYGMNIKDLNQIVRMAFGGETAGVVMEGERRFDLVVRLSELFRKDISNLRQLYVELPNGHQVPLAEVADISYQTGPAKISRDNAKRRIVIGVNVRNRDVESVVEEIQAIIGSGLKLPPGYHITYGGQFENLQKAKKRLMLVVPVALALIFIMLYFTFGSVSQALLVYTAIPLASIGGVLMLWVRGMPFSISAGIGFIALFGIAVLNGIVLIEYFNELEKSGVRDIRQRVLQGTKVRLRPVLLTASAAALGFFPMAFSTSAGAEVQRPLASVVIGGLITATLLTLVVLPVLYTIYKGRKEQPRSEQTVAGKYLTILFLAFGFTIGVADNCNAQKQVINLDQALEIAHSNNLDLQAAEMRIEQQQLLEKTSFNAKNTNIYYSYDENNIALNGTALNVYGIQQSFSLPHVYSNQSKLLKHQTEASWIQYQIQKTLLSKQVAQAYYELQYLSQKLDQLSYLDSLYSRFAIASNRRFELGESGYLEKINAEARYLELNTQKNQAESEVSYGYQRLAVLLQMEEAFELEDEAPGKLTYDSLSFLETGIDNPVQRYFEQQMVIAEARSKVEKSRQWPEIYAEYFLGRSKGEGADYFNGYQFGLGIPLIGGTQRGKTQAARVQAKATELQIRNYKLRWDSRYHQLTALLKKFGKALEYYEQKGLNMAVEIVDMANKSYLNGESGYLQYIESLESAKQINLSYLENLNQYNQTVLEIQYLINP
jgi:cobalt-zinc-cadmium resistance protein CzcA